MCVAEFSPTVNGRKWDRQQYATGITRSSAAVPVIANTLGVRRELPRRPAELQAAGLIHYRRGHITAIGRASLEARAFKCYEVIKESERFSPNRIAS